jgi:hypothetical protein
LGAPISDARERSTPHATCPTRPHDDDPPSSKGRTRVFEARYARSSRAGGTLFPPRLAEGRPNLNRETEVRSLGREPNMVFVAQLVEHPPVQRGVAGSTPVVHPLIDARSMQPAHRSPFYWCQAQRASPTTTAPAWASQLTRSPARGSASPQS